jgi:hypothetical protein
MHLSHWRLLRFLIDREEHQHQKTTHLPSLIPCHQGIEDNHLNSLTTWQYPKPDTYLIIVVIAMTILFSQSTRESTDDISFDRPASGCKRQKMMPPSPTSYDAINLYASRSENHVPSFPSFSRLDTGNMQSIGRPHRRTESSDFADFHQSAVTKSRPRSRSDIDHCIEHSSFNKQQPPFAAAARETGTFVAFTSQSKGSTFGTSSSFIGLEGLLPDDNPSDRDMTSADESAMIRQNSSVGLDIDGKQAGGDLSMETLSHPLAQLNVMEKAINNLDMPVIQS